jgi:2-iminobutanoate/2-iminopropanoate deaminase
MNAGRPYTPGYRAGPWLIVSGQTGSKDDSLVPGGFPAEFQQALGNVKHIIEEAGLTLASVGKVTIYLTDMSDYTRMNAVYSDFFNPHKPARTTVAVAGLPRNASVEVEAWAYGG